MPTIFFDYDRTANNFIDIEHLGNVCIKGVNEEGGFSYYLLIKTVLGTTCIYSYGPIVEEKEEQLIDGYTSSFQKLEFSEKVLNKYITTWLNDRNKKITGVYVIDKETFINNHLSIVNDLDKELTDDESFVA